MSLPDILRENFRRSIALYDDLAAELPESALAMKLPGLRSNTIGAQIWCVVGARESYARAIGAGGWAGFSCSLTAEGARSTEAVQAALARSGDVMLRAVDGLGAYDDARHQLVADLLEHEAAHQGQLIRYLYGLDLPIPERWKARYALD